MSHRTLLGWLAAPAVITLSALAPVTGPSSASAGGPPPPPQPHAAPRPNIVFVLADDLGWADLSTGRTNDGHANTYIETPAIADLADAGVAFDNSYACLNCAPSRAALLTGVYAPREQNNIYAVDSLNRGGDDTMLVGPDQGDATGDEVLPAATQTVAETLGQAGYDTGYIGKFHVARTPEDITTIDGWDENWGGNHSANATAYHASNGRFNDSVSPSLDAFAAPYTQEYVDQNIAPYSHGVSQAELDALVGTDKHVTDAVGDATIDFIDRHDSQPFMAWMAEYAVHDPVGPKQPRADLLAKYQGKERGDAKATPSYAALVEGLDQSVARLVDHLQTTPDPRNPGHPLADNTVVIFQSDNGGRTDLGADNGPLKGQKAELSEGGVRVPLIAWSENPRLVRGGRVESSPVNVTDFYPTVADYADAPLPRGVPFDGVSLRGAITHGAAVHRPTFQHMPGYVIKDGQDSRPKTTVRDGRWKLVYAYETQSWELYDLRADIGERDDLADARPEVVHRLGREMVRWLAETHPPLATLRPGRAPLTIEVRGTTYGDRVVHRYRDETLTIQPGQEVPLVLQDR